MKSKYTTRSRTSGVILGLMVLVLAGITFSAQSDTLNFTALETADGGGTNSSAADIATLEAQMYATYTDNAGASVSFQFFNPVGLPSSITDIYFFDALGLLVSPPAVASTAGVSFSAPASPGNLPGAWAFTPLEYSADSTPPASANGINAAGESLTLTYTYEGGKTFADVQAAVLSGNLLVGLHVQAIGTPGESDWFISEGGDDPGQPIPEPASLALLGLGVGALALRKRMK